MSATCPEYAFEVTLYPVGGGEPDAEWLAAFASAVAAQGLSIIHAYPGRRRYLVVRDGGQVVQADREAMRVWSLDHAAFGTLVAGPLIDLHELG